MRLAHRQGEDRILTVPNGLTFVRLLCIPRLRLAAGPPGSVGLVSGRPAARGPWASPIGSTATWPAISTRCRRSARCSTPWPTACCSAWRPSSIIVVGALPLWVAVGVLSREVLVAVGFLIVAAARRATHGRAVGRQGRHLRPDVRPAAVPDRPRPDDWHGIAEILAWLCGDPGPGPRLVRRRSPTSRRPEPPSPRVGAQHEEASA